jgi:NADH-quinone oxidoreductase subunit N
VSSYDLISFYLAIELQSLSFYVLAAYQRNSAFSTEAGLKYFVLGAVSSGLLLFGSSLIYGFSGTTSFEALSRLFAENFISHSNSDYLLLILGLIMLTCGLMFKLTAAPFHVWAPDVYEGAPMPTTAFFSIVPKVAVFALLIRILFTNFNDFLSFWQIILIICALASMIFGAFGALQQK